jgi:vesicle coat complex subunit
MPQRTTVHTLIAILRDPRRSRAQHEDAVRQLRRHKADAIPLLVDLLRDPDRAVQGRAVTALGNCGGAAIKALRAALTDADPAVRRLAALALGHTHHSRAVRPLVPVLADDDPAVRRAAAVALGWLANDYAVEALQTAAQVDDSAPVREAAQAALDKIARANAQRR